MKKMMSAFLITVILTGCSGNAGLLQNEADNKQAQINGTEEMAAEREEYEALVAELKEYDCGEFDYTGKERCFHERGTYEKGNCLINIQSDPHDYFVYYFYVRLGDQEKQTISIDSNIAIGIIDHLEEKGFIRTDAAK